MNYRITISQALLALQTFSMILTINNQSHSELDFSYFSGVMILIPTAVILCKFFLIDPTFIFDLENDSINQLSKEKCITLIYISLFSTFLLLIWSLFFINLLNEIALLIFMYFFSNIGEGMKLYLLNFSQDKRYFHINYLMILTSIALQQGVVSDYKYSIILFYLQSLPFFVFFVQNIYRNRNEKITIESWRVKEIVLQSAEGFLSFLELFIFTWVLRCLAQTTVLINFQQSIILMSPLNSLANLLSIGLYSRLLFSRSSLLRDIYKWSLISISLIYLVGVVFDPFGYISVFIKHGEISSIKDWLIAQIFASCCSLYVADKYFDLKTNKLGGYLLRARLFEIFLGSSIIILFILLNFTEYLGLGFFIAISVSTVNWRRVHRNALKTISNHTNY